MKPSEVYTLLWKKTKDLELAINCALVSGKIRNSYLFQHEGYPEFNGKLQWVKDIIIGLKCFKLVKIDQGILIFNKNTTLTFDKDDYTHEELGLFLGYPCAGDIDDKRNYGFHIYAEYKGYCENIYAMICGEITDDVNLLFNDIKDFMLKINKDIIITCKISKIYDYSMNDQISALKNYPETKIKKSLRDEILQTLTNNDCELIVELHHKNVIDVFNKKYIKYILSLMLTISAEIRYSILQNISDEKDFNKIGEIISRQKALSQKNYLENMYGLDITAEYDEHIENIDHDWDLNE